jgi:serine/threonine-protein kinase Chk2
LNDEIESEHSLYLVLECADGGELFDMIVTDGRFSEPVAKVYFLQMLNAVKYLHSIQITHRDLKPENILVGHRVENVSNKDSETVANHHRIIKIADMGLSKDETDNTVLKSFVGTPQYIAPEIIVSKLRYLSYTNKCDMWSLGVILYILLTGTQPFRPITQEQKDNGAKDLPQQICDGDYKKKGGVLDDISEDATDLITKLLEFQPKDRLSAQEALDHPWLNDDEAKMKVKKIMKSENLSKRRSPIPSPSQKRPYPTSSDTEETGEIEIISNENMSMNSEIVRPCKKPCLV